MYKSIRVLKGANSLLIMIILVELYIYIYKSDNKLPQVFVVTLKQSATYMKG